MRAAVYARVSTDRQAERDLSIPDQLHQTRQWCEQNGYTVVMEYVEAGASAMTDNRPVLRQMMEEACSKPSPFSAVVIHSESRFFRDHILAGLYERDLRKAGVKLISITQLTSEDAAGEMARGVIRLFDEYQSKENAKHTLRAMKENARQGYFNGSQPPFGYRKKEVPAGGRRGKKMVLEPDPSEAATVERIFSMYLDPQMNGVGQIAERLNVRGITR